MDNRFKKAIILLLVLAVLSGVGFVAVFALGLKILIVWKVVEWLFKPTFETFKRMKDE